MEYSRYNPKSTRETLPLARVMYIGYIFTTPSSLELRSEDGFAPKPCGLEIHGVISIPHFRGVPTVSIGGYAARLWDCIRRFTVSFDVLIPSL